MASEQAPVPATRPRATPSAGSAAPARRAATATGLPGRVEDHPGPVAAPPETGAPGPSVSLPALRRALLAQVAAHHPQADLGVVTGAFEMAIEAHQGQLRATGEPYVVHPIAAAQVLAELGLDPIAIAAALLHDVPEDTDFGLVDIEERFGTDVAHLVDGVTKLSRFSTHSHEERQAENIRKMLLAMAQDIRVVLIKLADRLHNMRTLQRGSCLERLDYCWNRFDKVYRANDFNHIHNKRLF